MSAAHRRFTRMAAGARPRRQRRATAATALVLAGLLVSLPHAVQAQFSPQAQAQCELSAIRDTRSAVAIQTIRSACNWLAVNQGSLLNESLRPYYVCLVQNLSGAQSDAAVGAIVSACRTANPG